LERCRTFCITDPGNYCSLRIFHGIIFSHIDIKERTVLGSLFLFKALYLIISLLFDNMLCNHSLCFCIKN
jgi:hypothetical protein